MDYSLERSGSKDTQHLDGCGETSRCVWGFVHRGGAAEAAYYVHWTIGAVRRAGARFTLVVGKWGEEAAARDRVVVALEFRWMESGAQFMVVDAEAGVPPEVDGLGRPLPRNEVIAAPLAPRVFAMVDAIWLEDPRIEEVTTR